MLTSCGQMTVFLDKEALRLLWKTPTAWASIAHSMGNAHSLEVMDCCEPVAVPNAVLAGNT